MPGRIVHFELVAADADRASGFWTGLFGWDVGGSVMEGFESTEGNTFSLWQNDPAAA